MRIGTRDNWHTIDAPASIGAVDLWDISEPEPNRRIETYGLYVAPSDDFAAGTVITGVQSADWVTEPDAIVVHSRPTNTLSVAPLPATAETSPVPLEGAGQLLTTVRDRIVALEAGSATRLRLFNVEGTLVGTLDLSEHYDFVERAFGVNNRIYLTVGREAPNNCTYVLAEWVLPAAE